MDSHALFNLKLQQLLAPPEQQASWQPSIDLVKAIDQWERDTLRAIQTCVDAIRPTSRQ